MVDPAHPSAELDHLLELIEKLPSGTRHHLRTKIIDAYNEFGDSVDRHAWARDHADLLNAHLAGALPEDWDGHGDLDPGVIEEYFRRRRGDVGFI